MDSQIVKTTLLKSNIYCRLLLHFSLKKLDIRFNTNDPGQYLLAGQKQCLLKTEICQVFKLLN